MQFNKTGYLPVNQVNSNFKKDKTVSDPIPSFKGDEPEKQEEQKEQKVYSSLAMSYLLKNGYNPAQSAAKEEPVEHFDFTAMLELPDETGHLRPEANKEHLMKYYKKDVETYDKLMSYRTKDGNYRFDWLDALWLDDRKLYRRNPELADRLIRLENEDGTPKLDAKHEVFNYIEAYSDYKRDLDKLLSYKSSNGEPLTRFGDVTPTDLEVFSKNKKVFESLINLETSKHEPVFNLAEITNIVQNKFYEKDGFYDLATLETDNNEKRFNYRDLFYIFENKRLSDVGANAIKFLASQKNEDGTFRFSADEIMAFPDFVNSEPEFCMNILNIKTKDGKPKYTLNDLREIGFRMSKYFNAEALKSIEKLCEFDEIPKQTLFRFLYALNSTTADWDSFQFKAVVTDKEFDFLPKRLIPYIFDKNGNVDLEAVKKLKNLPEEELESIDGYDVKKYIRYADFYGKQNINELQISEKKDLLRKLVDPNANVLISESLKSKFPLVPNTQEEFSEFLPAIVRSLGIETKELSKEKLECFDKSVNELSVELAKLSDSDFANLEITQEYSKDDFIKDVVSKTDALPENEKRKVFDYFGFELQKNPKSTNEKFSLAGYPVNLNNGKKLAQIKSPETKAVIESLRPDVIKFSENNKIHCNNEQAEKLLNEVIDVLPELRPTIGKRQHGTHDFDIFKHSLKVMQKVTQDPKFSELNESDKKVMLLAALLHDITKAEGYSDETHAREGSFDSFFIAKKFNLSKSEEVKLNTLIKHHEWLRFVNTSKYMADARIESVAYDLHQDNLFDMAEIFTHADLKAVKKDDTFHDTKEGKSRVCCDRKVRSFGESADFYAKSIRKKIAELKKSQPLLPQTKMPKASRINEAITQVNADGSTNIKGVYKNKDGVVILKYNEIEDWEKIGFPKGSVSRGIKDFRLDTGNIKFFVHGLDYPNQLAKFDAFSLVDSDALLSVSYAERPESKYRFFRPQGVILDANPQYIHGGGNTDAGSGCGKNIDKFKNDYIFGGKREKDRLFVSELVKKATGMTDDEYVKFFDENKGKSLTEIEPADIREKLIKAYASIESTERLYGRCYNEMYISNPNGVMGVFAYNPDEKATIGNPVEFVNKKKEFLKTYAIERDVPFVVFGD